MNERLQVFDTKMQKSLNSLEAELATIRAGRANPNVLNKLTVDYYGVPTPINLLLLCLILLDLLFQL